MLITNSTNCIGWVGENEYRKLYFSIEEELQSYLKFVDFELADGTKYTVGPVSSNTELLLDDYLLAQAGNLRVQLVLKDNNDVVAKSPVRLFKVYRSINADENIKDYIDEKDAETLQAAKDYTDTALENLDISSVSVTFANSIGLTEAHPQIGTFDTTKNHYFLVLPKQPSDNISLRACAVSNQILCYPDGTIKLGVGVTQNKYVDLVILDFVITGSFTTSGILQYDDGDREQNIIQEYNSALSYEVGQLFTYNDGTNLDVYVTIVAHNHESFNPSHNSKLSGAKTLYEYTISLRPENMNYFPSAEFKYISSDTSLQNLTQYSDIAEWFSYNADRVVGWYRASDQSAYQLAIITATLSMGDEYVFDVNIGTSRITNLTRCTKSYRTLN